MKPVNQEIVYVNTSKVMCEGKEVISDHPLIYLNILQETGYINCPYCNKKFILENKDIQ